MATVDEVFNSMEASGVTPLADIDESLTFYIDENLRIVSIPTEGIVLGVETDKEVNDVVFSCPKMYKSVDMSNFKARINYINAGNEPSLFEVVDKEVQGDNIIMHWLLSEAVTRYAGKVKFAVKLYETDDSGIVTRQFNTTIAEANSLEGLDVDSELPEDEYQSLIDELKAQVQPLVTSAAISEAKAKTYANNASQSASHVDEIVSNVEGKFIASAEATTLSPSSPATATVENQVLKIGVPKGDKGDKGDQGDKLTFEDLTQSDIEELQKPANDAIAECNSATSAATTATAKATEAASAANEAANEANAVIAQLPLPDGNVPRATKRGEVVSVDDAFAAVPLGLKVYGRTRQNLWVNPSGTSNGVTVTANEDGSITLSGTPGADSSITSGYIYSLKPSTSYTVQCDKPLSAGRGFYVREWNSSGGQIYVNWFGGTMNQSNLITFTTNHACVAADCGIGYSSGNTVSGTYRVMLNEGSTAEPWCPPGLTSAEPTKVVVSGKNHVSAEHDETAGSIKFTRVENGGIKVAGNNPTSLQVMFLSVAGARDDVYWGGDDGLHRNLAPGNYTLSGSTNNVYVYCNVYYSNAPVENFFSQKGSEVSLEIRSGYTGINVRLVAQGGIEHNEVIYPQLELGSTATDYEPPNVTTLTLDPVELRGLPDGTADVLDVGSGSVVKRTELDTYNGSESWVKDAGQASVGAYYKHNPGFRYKDRLSIISDGLPNENPYLVSYPCVTAFAHESGTEVRARTPSSDSVETHKAWLAANPVTVVYPLSTPTTSTVTPVALPTLPSPVCNVWAVSDVPCEVEMEYIRDVNVVLAKLEAAVASNALAIATN